MSPVRILCRTSLTFLSLWVGGAFRPREMIRRNACSTQRERGALDFVFLRKDHFFPSMVSSTSGSVGPPQLNLDSRDRFSGIAILVSVLCK